MCEFLARIDYIHLICHDTMLVEEYEKMNPYE